MLVNLFCVSLGVLFGWAFFRISQFHIEKRTQDIEKLAHVKKKGTLWLYIGFSAWGFALISAVVADMNARFEIMFLFSLCLSIGWIDWLISKIPNELLLGMILCKLLFLLADHRAPFIKQGLIGLALAFLIFMIPSLLGMPIGGGDIKYAAVIGFCFGLFPFFQVLLIMAAAQGAYLLYLLITKKGNWKTFAPMGPFISLGVMITALCPVL
jgi:Flp pilus assembly protein protease CpaA